MSDIIRKPGFLPLPFIFKVSFPKSAVAGQRYLSFAATDEVQSLAGS